MLMASSLLGFLMMVTTLLGQTSAVFKYVPNLDHLYKVVSPFRRLEGCANTLECCGFALGGRAYPPRKPYLYASDVVDSSGIWNQAIFTCRDLEDSNRFSFSARSVYGPYFMDCLDDEYLRITPTFEVRPGIKSQLGYCAHTPHDFGPTLGPGDVQCINILPPMKNAWLTGWLTTAEGLQTNGTVVPSDYMVISEYGGKTIVREQGVATIQLSPALIEPGVTYRLCARARNMGRREKLELHAQILPTNP